MASNEVKGEDLDDSFDDLCQVLPRFTGSVEYSMGESLHTKTEDDFQNWLISRFDRSGIITMRELMDTSFQLVKHHLPICCASYVPIALVAGILLFYRINILLAIWLALAEIWAFILILFFRGKQKSVMSTVQLLAKRSVCVLASSVIEMLLKIGLISSFRTRSSAITFFCLASMTCDYMVFFIPCLAFDGKKLSTSRVLKFNLKIMAMSGVQFSLFLFMCIYNILIFISPLTLGITYFTSYALRFNVFFSLCGTNNAVLTQ